MKSEFDDILPLPDRARCDAGEVLYIQTLEIRKIFARVLFSDDSELINEAQVVIKWANENPWLFVKHPVRDDG